MSFVYFDHAASAPRRDEVTAAMAPFSSGVVANPNGAHQASRSARRTLEEARDEIGHLLGIEPGGVVFTGGGTESCAMAVMGAVRRHRREHSSTSFLTSAIEHHAVLDLDGILSTPESGVSHHTIAVDGDGIIDLDDVRHHVQSDTAVVSVMAVNNETGVVEPLAALAEVVREQNGDTLIHTDAVAAAPWLDLAPLMASVDMLSFAGHKIGAPVNSGVLALKRNIALDALAPGGGQERGRRGGTVDVAAAVGLATALRLVSNEREETRKHVLALRQRLEQGLTALEGCALTAPTAQRVPGTVHVTFEGLASDELIFLLDQAGICASAASACSSGAMVASHVLGAMGMSPARANGSVRFSMGAENSTKEVDRVIASTQEIVGRLRASR